MKIKGSIAARGQRALLLLLTVSLQSCAVYDGPFEQISGRSVDPDVLRRLEAEHAPVAKVTEALGPPSEQRRSGDKTILIYRSVRARTSTERMIGITVDSSSQEFRQTWEVEFERGVLVGSRTSSEVVER